MKKKNLPLVSVVMGSDSDLPIMQESLAILEAFDIPCEPYLTSAHRAPERTTAFAKGAAKRGIKII
ncbi:MAG: AIR carboxylase family protein, partial [Syntrophales bacterium]